MRYSKEHQRYPHSKPETVTDVPAFVADLSKALGGGAVIPASDNMDKHDLASFMLGADLISVRGNHYGAKGRVEVRISAPEIAHDDHNYHDKTHRTQEATVNPEARTIQAIAADVKKRVIDASQEALKARREYAAQKAEGRDGIGKHIEDLKATFPALRVHRQSERDLTASVSTYGMGTAYMDARLNSNGTLYVDRISTVTMEQFKAICRILAD